jgi:hypothetical protein
VNSPYTTISNVLTSTETAIIVDDVTLLLPAGNLPYIASIGTYAGFDTTTETVVITNISGNVLTVTRGFQGTAKAWPVGSIISIIFTEYHLRSLQTNLNILYDEAPRSGIYYNPIINGDMQVWQRGTSFSYSASAQAQFTADRWVVYRASYQNNWAASQVVSGLIYPRYMLRVRRAQGDTQTGDLCAYQQIESEDARKFIGKTVTMQFLASHGIPGKLMRVEIIVGTGTDQNFFSGFTDNTEVVNTFVTLSTSLQRFSVNATIPANATEMIVRFSYAPTGTAGANDYFHVTGVAMSAGDNILPLQPNSYAEELRRCMRYFQKFNQSGATYGRIGAGMATSATNGEIVTRLPVVMRSNPSVVQKGTLYLTNGSNVYNVTAVSAAGVTPSVASLNCTTVGLTTGNALILAANNDATGDVWLESEI